MSPLGKQLSVVDISGGMITDINPVRLPDKAFQSIINAEYTRQGKLTKSTGYSVLPLAVDGEVRDIKGVYDVQGSLIGYLISQDVLRYVNDLGSPSVDNKYYESISAIVDADDGWYYYISGSSSLGRLFKWRMKSGTITSKAVGIRTLTEAEFTALKVNEAANPFRVNAQDLANNDSSLLLKWEAIGTATVVARFMSYSQSIVGNASITNPLYGIDSDVASYCTMWASTPNRYSSDSCTITYYGVEIPVSGDPIITGDVALSLLFNGSSHSPYYNCLIEYSSDNGANWTQWASYNWSTGGSIPGAQTTLSATLTNPVDLSKIKVRVTVAGATVYIFNTQTSYDDVGAAPKITIASGTDHPGIIGNEKFNRVVIPIKTNTLSSEKSVVLRLEKIQKSSGALISSESHTIAVGTTATEIDHTLTNGYYTHSDEQYFTKIILYPDAPDASADTLVFYRAKRWFGLTDGYTELLSNDDGTTTYHDREPLLALGLQNTLNTDTYAYAPIFVSDSGSEGSHTFTKSVTVIAGDVVYFNLELLEDSLNAAVAEGIDLLVICKSLAGGTGSLYRHKELATDDFGSLIEDDTTTAIWNMTTPTILSPKYMTDNRDIPLGTSVVEGSLDPDFDFLEDSLNYFRSRLWAISKETDTAGAVRTFIKYSELDELDLWPADNEVAIPDELEEIRPLREDLLLAYSLTKTYRVSPLGDGFDYLKIADVGCKRRMSVAAYDMIFWINQYGLYVYDGATVAMIKQSPFILSWIKKFYTANARASAILRDQKILWSATFDGTNYALVYDLTFKAFTLRRFDQPFVQYIELDGDLVNPMYVAFFDGAIGINGGYVENGSALETVIVSKRYQAADLSLIRTYYFGIVHNVEAQGALLITFTYENGTQVIKTIDLTDAENVGDLALSKVEVYGTGKWFEFEIRHTGDSNFEIHEYILGATPIRQKFPEKVTNAQEMA